MSITVGTKVKIKEGTEPDVFVGKIGVVIPTPEYAPEPPEWEWSVQLDFEPDGGPYGYDTDELEVIQ